MRRTHEEAPGRPHPALTPAGIETMHETWIPRLVIAIFLLVGAVLVLGVIAEHASAATAGAGEAPGNLLGLVLLLTVTGGLLYLGLARVPRGTRRDRDRQPHKEQVNRDSRE